MSTKSRPAYFVTFDFETDPFAYGVMPRAFLACLHDGKNTLSMWGDDCAARLVTAFCELSKDCKYVAYAHNGGKFDFHFLLEALVEKFGTGDLKIFCIGTRIVQIVTPLFELRDSFAIIPRALRDFGNKKEISIDKLEKHVRDDNRAEIISYCVQDCEGLHAALIAYFETYGRKSLTLASSAASYMRKEFKIKLPSTRAAFDTKFRHFYFGGRVEFFDLGKVTGNIKIVDINSAYPFAMMQKHWFSSSFQVSDRVPAELAEQSFFHVKCFSAGAFPYKSDVPLQWTTADKKTFTASPHAICFPHATLEYKVSGWEFLTAKALGLIKNVRIIKVYTPTQTQDFGEYVTHFYHLKNTAETDGERTYAKLYLNSFMAS
jgi:hypothetical protein